LPHLLKDLDESDTDFFTYVPDQIKGENMMDEFLKELNLPTYNRFEEYNFYDVLVLLCRENCMFALYPEDKKQKITDKLTSIFKKKNLELTEEKLHKFINRTIYEKGNYIEEFSKLNGNASQDDRIDLVSQLKTVSNTIGKKSNKQIDTWRDDKEDGLYSSKHVVYALRISRVWRNKVKNIKGFQII
jgi:hypothetical protein